MADAALQGSAAHCRREELDQRYRGPLMSYFLKRLRDRREAEDLTQEVFVRLMSHAVASQTADSFVFTIASNLLRDRARRKTTRHLEAHDSIDDPNAKSVAALVEEIGPERVLLARESLACIMEALNQLDERTRDIFVLFRLEKMLQRDIASLYGISVSAVEKQIVKAGSHLTAHLRTKD
jgi:RNA polymerase sigma-70 factor (ECF subfamily)